MCFLYPYLPYPYFPGGSDGKVSVYNAADLVRSLGWEDPLEKEMAIHSSTIAWKIPWTEEPVRLQSMGSQRVGHDWAASFTFFYIFTLTFNKQGSPSSTHIDTYFYLIFVLLIYFSNWGCPLHLPVFPMVTSLIGLLVAIKGTDSCFLNFIKIPLKFQRV